MVTWRVTLHFRQLFGVMLRSGRIPTGQLAFAKRQIHPLVAAAYV